MNGDSLAIFSKGHAKFAGTYLASGGDCGELVLWKRADGGDGIANEKSWVRAGLLRCMLCANCFPYTHHS